MGSEDKALTVKVILTTEWLPDFHGLFWNQMLIKKSKHSSFLVGGKKEERTKNLSLVQSKPCNQGNHSVVNLLLR